MENTELEASTPRLAQILNKIRFAFQGDPSCSVVSAVNLAIVQNNQF